MTTTIKLKRDTASNWTINNPVLALGEPGVETDTFQFKIGDGFRGWTSLPYSSYSLPTATTTVLGGVKVDGTSISISNGVISSFPYVLPVASTSTLGGVRVDGTTITINNGVITAVGGSGGSGGGTVNSGASGSLAYYPSAGTVVDDITNVTWSNASTTLTVVGTVSAAVFNGTLNASNLTGLISSTILPTASLSSLGCVKIDGTSITINDGVISVIPSTNNPIGYGTGAGSSVSVTGTDVSQTVTINKPCGTIICASAAGSATIKTVTVTNSNVADTDTIVISGKGGTNPYVSYIYAVSNGTFKFDYYSPSGTASEAPAFNFAIIKAVSA